MDSTITDSTTTVEQPELTNEQLRAMIEVRAKELEATAAAEGALPSTKLTMTEDGCIQQTVAEPTIAAEVGEFHAAAEYEGARPGFVFQMGPQGLGYYTDKQGRLLKALEKLEAKVDPRAAGQRALENRPSAEVAAPSNAAASEDVPEGKQFEVTFTGAKWGMTTRMVGGPVVVTKLKDGGQAKAAGIEIGDVVIVADGVSVADNRSQALARLRQGGAATLTIVRPKTAIADPAGLVTVGDAAALSKPLGGAPGEVAGEEWSVRQMQAMIGNAKAKDTVTVAGKRGVTETIADGAVSAHATLVFFGCEDCTYTIESYCVKLYVQDCKNLTINANTRIITSMIEVFKGEGVTLNVNTDCGTLQADMVNGLNVKFGSKDRFTMAIWAGCEDVQLSFEDCDDHLETGFSALVKTDATLSKERSQFKVSRVNGKLIQEKVIRLENGFTTTQREKADFELKQEANLKAMAKMMGVTIGPKKEGVKVKPNESCPCGSGLKFKKCCFSVDGVYKGDTSKVVGAPTAPPQITTQS